MNIIRAIKIRWYLLTFISHLFLVMLKFKAKNWRYYLQRNKK